MSYYPPDYYPQPLTTDWNYQGPQYPDPYYQQFPIQTFAHPHAAPPPQPEQHYNYPPNYVYGSDNNVYSQTQQRRHRQRKSQGHLTKMCQTPQPQHEKDLKYCRQHTSISFEQGLVNKGIQISESPLLPSRTVGIAVDEAEKFEILEDIVFNPRHTLVTVNFQQNTRKVFAESQISVSRTPTATISRALHSGVPLTYRQKLTQDHLRSISRHLSNIKCGYRSKHVSHSVDAGRKPLFSPPRKGKRDKRMLDLFGSPTRVLSKLDLEVETSTGFGLEQLYTIDEQEGSTSPSSVATVAVRSAISTTNKKVNSGSRKNSTAELLDRLEAQL